MSKAQFAICLLNLLLILKSLSCFMLSTLESALMLPCPQSIQRRRAALPNNSDFPPLCSSYCFRPKVLTTPCVSSCIKLLFSCASSPVCLGRLFNTAVTGILSRSSISEREKLKFFSDIQVTPSRNPKCPLQIYLLLLPDYF